MLALPRRNSACWRAARVSDALAIPGLNKPTFTPSPEDRGELLAPEEVVSRCVAAWVGQVRAPQRFCSRARPHPCCRFNAAILPSARVQCSLSSTKRSCRGLDLLAALDRPCPCREDRDDLNTEFGERLVGSRSLHISRFPWRRVTPHPTSAAPTSHPARTITTLGRQSRTVTHNQRRHGPCPGPRSRR